MGKGKNHLNDLKSRHIIGKCTFTQFCISFIEHYKITNLTQLVYSPPTINRALITKGNCKIYSSLSSKLMHICVELTTSGLVLDIDSNIIQYLMFLGKALSMGQSTLYCYIDGNFRKMEELLRK